MITFGIDISNYNPNVDVDWFRARIDEGYTDFVIRVGNESRFHVDTAIYQMRAAHEAGGRVSVYYWGYWQFDPVAYLSELVDITRSAGVPIFMSTIDAEDGDRYGAQNIANWLDAAFAFLQEQGFWRQSLYTGQWWWEGNMHISGRCTHIPLWYSYYDRWPYIEWQVQSFGGWEDNMVIGKQFRGDPLDLNVFEFPDNWFEEEHQDEEDPVRIEELEREKADLINKLGYITGDCMNQLQNIIDSRKMNKAGEREIQAVIDEVRRNA